MIARAIGAGLQAALQLARGRPEGLRLLDGTDDQRHVAVLSFWAAALTLPALIALHLLSWKQGGIPTQAARSFVLELITFVIGWAGFALVSHKMAVMLGREKRWWRFITVWNWCNLVQYLMLVVASVPLLMELPDWVGETTRLAAIGWALWLEWYATKLTLGLPTRGAVLFVAVDILIGLFLAGIEGSLG